ncbi:hypothetical protein Poly30_52220 [Planctomycetes bacterium Poly30]|uniref:DUF5060 domain-containing protein n=1 Tax=Saltatorellus ferox TaxID=2528018 RepID=A0A518EZZ8_9BACT|nr:hypothetical protein Poly30_52220 [Planctomycetes bacterium Poly30]
MPAYQTFTFNFATGESPDNNPGGPFDEAAVDVPYLAPTQFNNPWLHWRLTAVVTPPGNLPTYEIAGFFNGSGPNPAVGDRWRVHFTAPTLQGLYSIRFVFEEGPFINVSDAPAAAAASPTFVKEWNRDVIVIGPEQTAPGFLAKGPILAFREPGALGTRYLRHSNGETFLKGGVGSPENFLAYSGFTDYTGPEASVDGVGSPAQVNGFIHEYQAHELDWDLSNGDPEWTADGVAQSGRGIIGALNYLSSVGVNSMYMLLMNLGGDGRDVHPFIGTPKDAADSLGNHPVAAGTSGDVRRNYSVKRMREWTTVFEHAMARGIMLQFFLAETEGENIAWLGAGSDSIERRLFQKNMVAMFGHLQGVKWNLCEENILDPAGNSAQFTVTELTDMAHWIQRWDISDYDPYRSGVVGSWIGHPISVHGAPNLSLQELYTQIRDQVSDADWWLDCTSMQLHGFEQRFNDCSSNVAGPRSSYSDFTESIQSIFVAGSSGSTGSSSRFVVMDVDEQGSNNNGVGDESPGAGTPCATATSEDRRKRVLFDVLLSGGNIDWYFGYYSFGGTVQVPDRSFGGGDLRVENFRTRAMILTQTRAFRELLSSFPLRSMEPSDGSVMNEANDAEFGDAEVLTDHDSTYVIYYPTLGTGSTANPGTVAVTAPSSSGPYDYVGRWFNASSTMPIGSPTVFQLTAGGGSHSPDTSSLDPALYGSDYIYLITRVN